MALDNVHKTQGISWPLTSQEDSTEFGQVYKCFVARQKKNAVSQGRVAGNALHCMKRVSSVFIHYNYAMELLASV
jgi:hypothetical protein